MVKCSAAQNMQWNPSFTLRSRISLRSNFTPRSGISPVRQDGFRWKKHAEACFFLVTRRGFEPRTHCLKGSCSANWASGSDFGWDGRIWTDEMPESKSGALPLGDIPILVHRPLVGHTAHYNMEDKFLQSFFEIFLNPPPVSGKVCFLPGLVELSLAFFREMGYNSCRTDSICKNTTLYTII